MELSLKEIKQLASAAEKRNKRQVEEVDNPKSNINWKKKEDKPVNNKDGDQLMKKFKSINSAVVEDA